MRRHPGRLAATPALRGPGATRTAGAPSGTGGTGLALQTAAARCQAAQNPLVRPGNWAGFSVGPFRARMAR